MEGSRRLGGGIICFVGGAILTTPVTPTLRHQITRLIQDGCIRGRDSWGAAFFVDGGVEYVRQTGQPSDLHIPDGTKAFLFNNRAEPTTEYVADKTTDDVQPFSDGNWAVAHNGTIANDAQLRDRFGSTATNIDSGVLPPLFSARGFGSGIKAVKGSYAVLAIQLENNGKIHGAVNYKPLYTIRTDSGWWFASQPEALPAVYGASPTAVRPYTRFNATPDTFTKTSLRQRRDSKPRALVVASGGMDSTVAAAQLIEWGHDVDLLHFTYGCRAQERELEAIERIGHHFNADVHTITMDSIFSQIGGSPLLDKDAASAPGEAGAEFAHEWVPARNLVMVSLATAYAEAHGYDVVATGANLEEAGAYPDNEPEFYRQYSALLPYAVGPDVEVVLSNPVVNMMKHEIVALGLKLDAPLHLTWSCYDGGVLHCGDCGPCYMRRTAFQINNAPDPMEYQ